MKNISSLVLSILLPIYCSCHLSHDSGQLPLNRNKITNKRQLSYQPIFTVNSSGYNFITDQDGNKDKKNSWQSILKKYISFQKKNGNFNKLEETDDDQTDDAQVNDGTNGEKSDLIQKSSKPKENDNTTTKSTTRLNSLSNLSGRIMPRKRKGNFNKLGNTDDDQNGAEVNRETDGNERDFIYKPFKPKENDDTDTESTTSRKSWSSILKKIGLGSLSPSSSLSRSSSSNSETDDVINQLLDDYSHVSDNGGTVRTATKSDDVQLPGNSGFASPISGEIDKIHVIITKPPLRICFIRYTADQPKISIEKFSLCSEIRSGRIEALKVFSDGQAPTCTFACLHYKIKHSIFAIKPEGRCARLSMNGHAYGTTVTEFTCICSGGAFYNFEYKIVQREQTLYYVYSEQFGAIYPQGSIKEMSEYIETNFRRYLVDFVKNNRAIDWECMYKYVRDFRWVPSPRPVGRYLSEIMMETIDNIKQFWNTLPARLLTNKTETY